jgi:hypothetical protein
MNRKIILGLAVVLGCILADKAMMDRRASRPTAPKRDEIVDAAPAPAPEQRVDSPVTTSDQTTVPPTPQPPTEQRPASAGTDPQVMPASAGASTPKKTAAADGLPINPAVAPKQNPSANPKPPTDPLPRLALSFVGVDGDAEMVWADAINDPGHPANERKDLIEDLNEDGFPDPKHVTANDLPLIVSRLMLIEQLAPSAMDDVNAAAFAEAYKDLVQMFDKAAR